MIDLRGTGAHVYGMPIVLMSDRLAEDLARAGHHGEQDLARTVTAVMRGAMTLTPGWLWAAGLHPVDAHTAFSCSEVWAQRIGDSKVVVDYPPGC